MTRVLVWPSDKGAKCNVAECDREATVRGHCKRCYYRLRAHGELNVLPRKPQDLPMCNGEEKLRKVWRTMRARCADVNNRKYGGRGIAVCPEWSDYDTFRAWAIDAGYRDGLSIDRIDNDGDYRPGNCRWANHLVQANNTRTNHRVTAFGERQSIAEWARDPRCQVSVVALYLRITRRHWPAEKAISTPAELPPSERTHCPAGHAYTDENTRIESNGGRKCRACCRDRARRAYRVRRGAPCRIG